MILKYTKYAFAFLFTLVIGNVSAQEDMEVLQVGKITYKRSIYLIKSLEDMGMADGSYFSRMKDKLPKTVNTNYSLYFDPSESFFRRTEEQDATESQVPSWFQTSTQSNEVYMNLEQNQMVIAKTTMGKDFVIEDEIPKIQWKISDEYRTIAEYRCRKATAILDDSLFVIAFYTDAILPSTGPEHFTGLPGAILGVAIPRFHTNYMATKVEKVNFDKSNIDKPKKGTKASIAELREKLFEMGEGFKKGYGQLMAWSLWI